MKATVLASMTTLGILFLTSCGEKQTPEATKTEQQSSSLEYLILKEEPADAVSVNAAKKNPEPGKEITITGKVMGTTSPIVENRAVVVIGDPAKLTSCDLRPGDSCTTPWDVCCDEQEVISANIATIQVLDKERNRIKETLRGVGGLKELSELTITGVIDESSSKENLIINATGIYLKP